VADERADVTGKLAFRDDLVAHEGAQDQPVRKPDINVAMIGVIVHRLDHHHAGRAAARKEGLELLKVLAVTLKRIATPRPHSHRTTPCRRAASSHRLPSAIFRWG